MPGSTHVPGQYLGYSQQATRVLVYLLSSPLDASVSLEVLDDSAVHLSGGMFIAEQSKSAAGKNPIADSSVEFWKTIWNWLNAHTSGELPVCKTRYVLYVNDSFESNIPLKFSEASTTSEAANVIQEAEQWFVDKLQKKYGTEKPDKLSGADEYIQAVLGFNQDVLRQLVCNFGLECGSGDAQDDLLPLVLAKGIRRSLAPIVEIHLQGWVKKTTDRLLADGQKAIIGVQQFIDEMRSFYRGIDVATALFSTAPAPTQEQIENEFSKIFVQQLDVIDQSVDDKIRAIDHYLRAAHDRTRWGVDFDVNEISFKAFECELEEFWDIARQKTAMDFKNEPATERGQRTYLRCRECQRPLQGMTTPTHFIQGSFHRLADSLKIGWHPEYKIIIEEIQSGKQ